MSKNQGPETSDGLKAYMCTHDDADGHCLIIFASTAAKAKNAYCSQADTEYIEVRATRKKQFDRHAPGPVPVMEMLEDGWWFECSGCGDRITLDSGDFIEDHSAEELAASYKRQAPYQAALDKFDRENSKPDELPETASLAEKNKRRNEISDYHHQRRQLSRMILPPMLSRSGLRPHDESNTIHCSPQCEQKDGMRVALINHQHEVAELEAAKRWPGCSSYTSKRYPYLEANVAFRPEGMEYDAQWKVKDDTVFVAQQDKPAWDAYLASLHDSEDLAA